MESEYIISTVEKTGATLYRSSGTKLALRRLVTSLKDAITRGLIFVKDWMKKPNVLPTYCFEYAPDC